MRIDGKALADAMLSTLAKKVPHPTLAVILVGDNPESLAYIRQKQKAVERIGGRFIFEKLPDVTTQKELTARVAMYNSDPAVAGLIVQRPLPPGLTARVAAHKDIDGLEGDTLFDVPVAMAIFTILKTIHADFRNKKIVIVGRGETAGKPIAAAFAKEQCATSIVDSKTASPQEIMKNADILISCVGKQGIVTQNCIKPGAILISVGLSRGADGKLHGDYEEEDVAGVAGAYTPTPGGVGPLNIACLMQNLVKACMMK